mgnify:CR=1 FL=1
MRLAAVRAWASLEGMASYNSGSKDNPTVEAVCAAPILSAFNASGAAGSVPVKFWSTCKVRPGSQRNAS